jgi:hypothetical protein
VLLRCQHFHHPWRSEFAMARFKHYDYEQTKLLPINYERQILPGTFEYTLSYLIDHKIDLSVFEDRYQNDGTGAPAYDLALLLQIVLSAREQPWTPTQLQGIRKECL